MNKKGAGVIIVGLLNSGILATGLTAGVRHNYVASPPEIAERVGRFAAVCVSHNMELPASALKFLLGHPAIVGIITGAMNAGEVTGSLCLFRKPLPAALWADLRQEGLLDPAAPLPLVNA